MTRRYGIGVQEKNAAMVEYRLEEKKVGIAESEGACTVVAGNCCPPDSHDVLPKVIYLNVLLSPTIISLGDKSVLTIYTTVACRNFK